MEISVEDNEKDTNTTNKNNLESMKRLILEGLTMRSSKGWWIWYIFAMCFLPGVLNGLQISSYVFLGQSTDDFWCVIPELLDSGWSNNEMMNISTLIKGNDIGEHGCKILNWDYNKLSSMKYSDALKYVETLPKPSFSSCLSRNGNYYHYEQEEGVSIVTEWDLVCGDSILRTQAQGALALGKLIGAFVFGIIADKYGRRLSFILSSIIYIISGPVTAFVPWYSAFIVGRIGIGIAGSGVYHTGYIILNEISSQKHRLWMSIFFSSGYPVGMVLLSVIAYLIHDWRYLQLAISLPTILLIYHCFAIVESPRWLLNQNRIDEAYKIVFKKDIEPENKIKYESDKPQEKYLTNMKGWPKFVAAFKNLTKELSKLYGSREIRKRTLICHFTWFASSLSYYAIALNAENFSTDRYIYVAITGFVEIPSYIMPILILRYIGRRSTSQILFTVSGVSLLALLAIPQELDIWTITVAMIGRLCISSVFAVVILHTSDMFATEVRSSAIGMSSTFAHIGSISAPYIVDILGAVQWFIPTTICAIVALLAALSTIGLPETNKKDLTDKVEDDL